MEKQRLVNWTDSMALSSKLFVQTENYFLSAIAQNAGLNLTKYNYGLLPSNAEHGLYNGIRVSEHITGHIEVQLYSCRAITVSGYQIDFDSAQAGAPLIKQYSPADDKNIRNRDIRHWDVILSVDPFNREPVGEPDPEEVPPRHPDCQSKYALYVMPIDDINTMDFGRHHLTIGRVRKDADRYVVDTNYIPPSASMSSHPELLDYYNKFSRQFLSIEQSSKAILAKVHNRSSKNDLGSHIQIMCRDILRYISQIYFKMRNTALVAPPIEMVNYISSLAHVCYISMLFLENRQKEDMLKYFYEWSDVSPGSFEELIAGTLGIIYEHDKLRAMMVRSEHFMHTFADLWERMSKLEYIGQRKESIVVSERKQEKDNAGTVRTWSITE